MRNLRSEGISLLGGPLSAVLLGLSFEPYRKEIWAWLALLPLLLSLGHHQGRPGMRLAHGISFGFTLSAWSLSWFFQAFLAAFSEKNAPAGAGALLSAALCCAMYWTLISLFPGLFALAAGPVLRSRNHFLTWIGLPLLWCGLEVLRGPCSPVPSAWVSNWLSLGYALRPDALEAQAASVVGVYGLSFAIALANTAFFLSLRGGRWPTQGLFVLVGCLIPLLLRSFGLERVPREPLHPTFSVAVVAQERPDLENLVRLSCSRLEPPPKLILGPDLPTLKLKPKLDSASWPRGLPPELVQKLRSTLVLAAEAEPDGPGRMETVALLLDPEGKSSALVRRQYPGKFIDYGKRGNPPGLLPLPVGKVGLGLGFDLDFPAYARKLVAEGSTFLASSARDLREWGERAVQQHAALQLFRAVENGRWLVRTSGSGALIADPYGRKVLELLSGFDSAGAENVALLREQSIYTRGGWWIEPVLLLGALSILAYWALGPKKSLPPAEPEPVA